MKEPKLRELSGSSRLALGFFNSLIRRIECTKPVAGSGIIIQESADGIIINGGIPSGFGQITLNVCSNGVPAELIVIGKFV